jgi:hypothetical protein
VEGNCHFLEFPAPKRHAAPCAAKLGKAIQSASAKSDAALAGAALRKGAALPELLVDRGAMRGAKLADARRQGRRHQAIGRREAIERQVRLYCFRLGNCGTFMPLFCVWGKSKIAAVWSLFAAAFSAVAPVPFRFLSTHGAVLSAVDYR